MKSVVSALLLFLAMTVQAGMPAPLLGSGANTAQWSMAEMELSRALRCESLLRPSEAVRGALGATNSRIQGRYVLPKPILLFGFQVSVLQLDDGVDSGRIRYAALIGRQSIRDVRKSAGLHLVAGQWIRQTSMGQLSAHEGDEGVWLSCRLTQFPP